MSPKRILFVGEAVSMAHIGRPLMLARWAREVGHQVVFACDRKAHTLVKNEGLNVAELSAISSRVFHERLSNASFFYTENELAAYVQAERELIARIKPDLIVGDFRLTLGISSHCQRVPYMALANAYWSPNYGGRSAVPNVGPFKYLRVPGKRFIYDLLRPMVEERFCAPLNRLRHAHGLEPLKGLRGHYTFGDYCAYADHPLFMPVNPLPLNHFYVGALPWAPQGHAWNPLAFTNDGRPLAYLSMGSYCDVKRIKEILAVLIEKGLRVIVSGVTSGEARDDLEFDCPKGRVHFQGLVDPGVFLDQACVTVCHGGSGTVYQSLLSGVPVLCLPSNPDQAFSAEAVVNSGAGISLEFNAQRPKRLAFALNKLLTEGGYKESACSWATQIKRFDSRKRWMGRLKQVFSSQTVLVG